MAGTPNGMFPEGAVERLRAIPAPMSCADGITHSLDNYGLDICFLETVMAGKPDGMVREAAEPRYLMQQSREVSHDLV